ncbi:MAG TPA: hypothetical protein VGA24_03820 [Steroidobacteraceae bacterium]
MRSPWPAFAATVVLSCGALLCPATSHAADSPLEEVLAAAATIVAAFGRHDPDAYFALFDAEATFIFYTTPGRLENRAA